MAFTHGKLSERAKRALSAAQEEAKRLKHNYIGTEHMLLGLIADPGTAAARILSDLNVNLDTVRHNTTFLIGHGENVSGGELAWTPRARMVIELAQDEARRMNHSYIGTEHLLIGILREKMGVAAGVLKSFGLTLDKVRPAAAQLVPHSTPPVSPPDIAGLH